MEKRRVASRALLSAVMMVARMAAMMVVPRVATTVA